MPAVELNLDARIVANAVLEEAFDRGYDITNLKLQKLLFLCHAFFFIEHGGTNLIRNEFEAWQYGPVHREAYDAFRSHGQNSIKSFAKKINPLTGEQSELPKLKDKTVEDIIVKIIKHYGGWSAAQLVKLTHAKNGPWDYVIKSAANEANIGLKIDNKVISERFKYLWFGTQNKAILEKDISDEKPIVA